MLLATLPQAVRSVGMAVGEVSSGAPIEECVEDGVAAVDEFDDEQDGYEGALYAGGGGGEGRA